MYYSTPLLNSQYFPQPVLLKLENTQPSGSFKSRGMTALVEKGVRETPNCEVFSSSGGNAGLAAAEAAHGQGVPCTVVVPITTKSRMIARIEKIGAKVIVEGSMWSEADAHLQKIMATAQEKGVTAVYCHPFDNEVLWNGHSTMIPEIFEAVGDAPIGAIVLSCGGGGLYLGVMKGLEDMGLAEKVPVFVVETEGAATFHDSLAAGRQVILPSINTIATSLGSVYVPQAAVDYGLKYKTRSVLISDEEAAAAVKKFASDHCMIVEPACAATLAAIYKGSVSEINDPIVAIVCGGSSWGSVEG